MFLVQSTVRNALAPSGFAMAFTTRNPKTIASGSLGAFSCVLSACGADELSLCSQLGNHGGEPLLLLLALLFLVVGDGNAMEFCWSLRRGLLRFPRHCCLKSFCCEGVLQKASSSVGHQASCDLCFRLIAQGLPFPLSSSNHCFIADCSLSSLSRQRPPMGEEQHADYAVSGGSKSPPPRCSSQHACWEEEAKAWDCR